MIVGIGSAVCAILAGWGILAAVAVYSAAGSLALVGAVTIRAARRSAPLCATGVKAAAA